MLKYVVYNGLTCFPHLLKTILSEAFRSSHRHTHTHNVLVLQS